jgi:hypothetical protein
MAPCAPAVGVAREILALESFEYRGVERRYRSVHRRKAPGITNLVSPLINCRQVAGRGAAGCSIFACPADADEHERAGSDSSDAESDQPWIGLMQAEDQPAGELAEDQLPGSG